MKRLGSQTLKFDNPITILETASIVGPKEADGPMADYFDKCLTDEFWEEKTWEKAESKIIKETKYNSLVNARTSEYQKLVDKIDEANSKVSEEYSSKNAIPNLLNKIMYNIPVGVQLLSIENQSGKDIVITAQAEKYDQLGYFKAALEEEGILTDIISTRGTKPGELISITITGKLPY